MSLKIKEISTEGYERVIHATNETTKLDCIISIHNTALGPALGGVRSWSYNSFDEQKADALRLSEAMTLKNSACGINFGGGKAALNLQNTKKILDVHLMISPVKNFIEEFANTTIKCISITFHPCKTFNMMIFFQPFSKFIYYFP